MLLRTFTSYKCPVATQSFKSVTFQFVSKLTQIGNEGSQSTGFLKMVISLKQGDKEHQADCYWQQFSVILTLFAFFAFSVCG